MISKHLPVVTHFCQPSPTAFKTLLSAREQVFAHVSLRPILQIQTGRKKKTKRTRYKCLEKSMKTGLVPIRNAFGYEP